LTGSDCRLIEPPAAADPTEDREGSRNFSIMATMSAAIFSISAMRRPLGRLRKPVTLASKLLALADAAQNIALLGREVSLLLLSDGPGENWNDVFAARSLKLLEDRKFLSTVFRTNPARRQQYNQHIRLTNCRLDCLVPALADVKTFLITPDLKWAFRSLALTRRSKSVVRDRIRPGSVSASSLA
jgi:hypothetical protein